MADQKPKRETNPLIWGVVVGLIAALLVILTPMAGAPTSPNDLLQNPLTAGGMGFFWGWVAGSIKVWYGNRLNRKL
jgi:hypothetical protein